jgi:predicted GNAT superfamily acetyltransferase
MSLAGGAADFEIRPLTTIQEYRACVELQEETWGEGFSEGVPPAILKVSQLLGGICAGAYDAHGRMVGFVFGMTGPRDGELVHWSDMLAVRAQGQNTGLGTRLKAYQREQLLARGVETMYWTFDPLQSCNAYVNFSKLGVVVREYESDMYGDTDSPLHRGVGTDRFVARWLMSTERVVTRLAGDQAAPSHERFPDAQRVLGGEEVEGVVHPGTPDLGNSSDQLLVAIPADILEIMTRSMDVAVQWRKATRAVLTHYLSTGYEVCELLRAGPTSDYLLKRLEGMNRTHLIVEDA